jgi:ammonium transporter, Amt family
MNPAAPMSESGFALAFGLLLLAPLALAGVALINTGLGRSRSAAQALLGALAIGAAAIILFALVGATIAAPGAGAGHILTLGGKPWSWAGTGPILLTGFAHLVPRTQLGILFQFFAVAMAALIPWGSGADRLRISAGIAVAAVLAALAFPLFAHWIWGPGWLGDLGKNFGLGAGFLDTAGAATAHVLGGFVALCVIWIAGPRQGKFPREGISTAIPGHNAVYVLLGCSLALVGWIAWNTAGALLWLDAPATAAPLVAINTLLAAAGALGATFAVTRLRFGKPDASLCANGWLAGLVVSSACSGVVPPIAALFIGVVAGGCTPLLVEFLELALSLDDPSGSLTVHLASGLWGLIAAGIFAPGAGQFLAQLIGIAALLGIALPLIYLLCAMLNRVVPFRVDPDGERIGMDLHELGGAAYPEFVVHRDESYR